ncbi:MAG: prepilin-type N-terminal cleavage/methylation domain-containing protein [Planctomycetes bacterium]|nr:prepilin-type N-terminal cleavage/methylation domain-containing protein [Planctomycetota bacterium]
MRTRHGTSGGFTLLEVLLAMILLVLLAGAAVFAFSGWQTRAALNEGAERFAVALRAARLDAARLGRRLRIAPDPAGDASGTGAPFVLTWEPRPLEAPGEFVPYEGLSAALRRGDDLVRVRRCRLTGDAAYGIVWLGEGTETDLAPVTFYPDGSGDSAQIVLVSAAGDDARAAVLDVDGLTGDVTVDVMSAERFARWWDEHP